MHARLSGAVWHALSVDVSNNYIDITFFRHIPQPPLSRFQCRLLW